MGSHNSWKIDMDVVVNKACIPAIEKWLANPPNQLSDESCLDMWHKFCGSSKWYGAPELVAALSKLFPKVVFSLERNGESGSGKWFYLNGQEACEAYVMPPKFPSPAKVKHGLVVQASAWAAKAANEKKEAVEFAESVKRDRIELLEKELSVLKKKAS